jgi:hypothetical protein
MKPKYTRGQYVAAVIGGLLDGLTFGLVVLYLLTPGLPR